jgi:hypothetical protein
MTRVPLVEQDVFTLQEHSRLLVLFMLLDLSSKVLSYNDVNFLSNDIHTKIYTTLNRKLKIEQHEQH